MRRTHKWMAAIALLFSACGTSSNKNDNGAASAPSGQLIEVVDVLPAQNDETHDQRWVAECKKVAADGTLADQPLHFYFNSPVQSFGDSAKTLAGRRFTVTIKRQQADDVLEFEAVEKRER